MVDQILYFFRCNKWKKALAQKALCVYTAGLKPYLIIEEKHSARSSLLSTKCQRNHRSVYFWGRGELSNGAEWAVIETGQLKDSGMNSLDGGQRHRVICAIIELTGSDGYSDCNGSDA